MKVSKKGIDLIKEYEGCYLKAYQDSVGVWTIGYGITNADRSITGKTIKRGLTISKETAEKWLEESLDKKYLPLVMKYNKKYNWNQNELDAMVSFCYNVGSINGLTANGTRSKAVIANKMLEYAKDINAGGWDASDMRTFVNTRVYDAFPTTWKSILKKVKINASAGNQSTEILVSEDYVYLPSYTELSNSQNSPYVNEGTYIKWFTTNAVRCKFRGQVIPDGAQYITSDTDPTLLTSTTVKPGDIWINTNNSSIGYYYIPAELKDKHYYYGGSDNIQASNGGLWLRAPGWWERSPLVSSSTNFMFVGNYGYPYNNLSASNAIAVVPCFSI